MPWPKRAKTTPHTCGGVNFGRKTAGCPRCDELTAGAAPVAWGGKPAVKSSPARACAGHPMCSICCVCNDW